MQPQKPRQIKRLRQHQAQLPPPKEYPLPPPPVYKPMG